MDSTRSLHSRIALSLRLGSETDREGRNEQRAQTVNSLCALRYAENKGRTDHPNRERRLATDSAVQLIKQHDIL